MLRIMLFLGTNIAIIALISVTFRILGLDDLLAQNGVDLDMQALLVYSAVIGFSGSLISLFMSKFMAKKSMGVHMIEQPQNQDEMWLLNTVQQQAQGQKCAVHEVEVDRPGRPTERLALAEGARWPAEVAGSASPSAEAALVAQAVAARVIRFGKAFNAVAEPVGQSIMNQTMLAQCSYGPYSRAMVRICKEESFHARQGYDAIRKMAFGSPEQKRMAQDALNRMWFPCLMMFEPSDAESVFLVRIALDVGRKVLVLVGVIFRPRVALGQFVVGNVQHPSRL